MIKRVVHFATVAGFALPLPVSSFAADFAVEIVATGDEFRGYPKFQFKAGNKLIAAGEVTAQRDSEGQLLRFEVEGDPASLSFSFINDLYEHGVGDRNLIIKNFTINGQSVAEDRFSSTREGRNFDMNRSTTITLTRPDTGWVSAQTTDEKPGTPKLNAPSGVSGTGVGEAATKPEPPPRDAAKRCKAAEFVIPFAHSSLFVSEKDTAPVLAAAKAPSCRINVIGYADRSGPSELNKSISEARAKAVADVLIRGGIDEDSIILEGRGETQKFGAAGANRRVVVTVDLDG